MFRILVNQTEGPNLHLKEKVNTNIITYHYVMEEFFKALNELSSAAVRHWPLYIQGGGGGGRV